MTDPGNGIIANAALAAATADMNHIGGGTFGDAYKYDYRNGAGEIIPVVVKIFKSPTPAKIMDEIQTLRNLKHPNVIHIWGHNATKIVTEFAECGSLMDAIRNNSLNIAKYILSWYKQTASGLCFMHANSIVHRDIKPDNLLLTISYSHVKICDFGYARDVEPGRMSAEAGTYLYMAPEVITGNQYDQKCDVYSTAITFFYVDTRVFPHFVSNSDVSLFIYQIPFGARPDALQIRNVKLRDLIVRSWHNTPSERPSMQEVLRDVSEMHDAEQRLAQLVVLRYNQATRRLLVHNVIPSKIASNFNLMLDETLMLVDDDDVVHMIHPKLDIFEPEPEPGKKFVVEGTISPTYVRQMREKDVIAVEGARLQLESNSIFDENAILMQMNNMLLPSLKIVRVCANLKLTAERCIDLSLLPADLNLHAEFLTKHDRIRFPSSMARSIVEGKEKLRAINCQSRNSTQQIEYLLRSIPEDFDNLLSAYLLDDAKKAKDRQKELLEKIANTVERCGTFASEMTNSSNMLLEEFAQLRGAIVLKRKELEQQNRDDRVMQADVDTELAGVVELLAIHDGSLRIKQKDIADANNYIVQGENDLFKRSKSAVLTSIFETKTNDTPTRRGVMPYREHALSMERRNKYQLMQDERAINAEKVLTTIKRHELIRRTKSLQTTQQNREQMITNFMLADVSLSELSESWTAIQETYFAPMTLHIRTLLGEQMGELTNLHKTGIDLTCFLDRSRVTSVGLKMCAASIIVEKMANLYVRLYDQFIPITSTITSSSTLDESNVQIKNHIRLLQNQMPNLCRAIRERFEDVKKSLCAIYKSLGIEIPVPTTPAIETHRF